jgi:predicted AlkP superfamily pyrophosphatase or phosphodiesterase
MRLGSHDLLLITIDTLRFDVAEACWRDGSTPHLRAQLPDGWEKRHAPGNFTFASHAAMLAGFLPTPARPGKHVRRFALRFEGSETIGDETLILDGAHLPEGFRRLGYRTICIGGVGFFNMRNELGRVLPSMFDEAHWSPELGVTDPRSTERQVDLALSILSREERAFLFLNVSALHQPNWFYSKEGPREDTIRSHMDALRYVDGQLGRLLAGLVRPTFVIVCSDHGTAYGEDGYFGHRLAHEVVWTVPYAEFLVEP